MVPTAGADVANGHARPYCKKPRELAGFIKGIALPLRGAAWAYDFRNGAFRLGKRARRFARRREVGDLNSVDATGAWRESQERRGDKRCDDATGPHALCETHVLPCTTKAPDSEKQLLKGLSTSPLPQSNHQAMARPLCGPAKNPHLFLPQVGPDTDTWNSFLLEEAFRAGGLPIPEMSIVRFSLHLRTQLLTTGRCITAFPNSVLRLNDKRFFLKALPVERPARRGQSRSSP
jgi:hypothetical protein